MRNRQNESLATKIKMSIGVLVVMVLAGWMAMIGGEYQRVMKDFELPQFAKATQTEDDGGSGTYEGLGYKIVLEGNFMPEEELPGVTQADFYLFGFKTGSVVRD